MNAKNMEKLKYLSDLIHKKNAIEDEIAALIRRPAQIGHVGEFIAAAIFDIQLMDSASHKAIDGYFQSGPLAGRSVNIKWYGKREGILDITPNALPELYLVMTGPKSAQLSSRGGTRPWRIDFVFLFLSSDLVDILNQNRVKIGIATSVPKALWDQAEIYPDGQSPLLTLSPAQKMQLGLFTY